MTSPHPNSPEAAPPALTPLARIEAFEKVVLAAKQSFACGGTIAKTEIDPKKFALYYSTELADGHGNIMTFPPTEQALDKFYQLAQPSPFGKGEEKVFDPSYRQAREYRPPHFGLSHDLISCSAVLSILSANLQMSGDLRATINKVNAYATGGFFKEHRDTPLGTGHIGTITFCLPTTFAGGELVVSKDGTEVVFDWGKRDTAGIQPGSHEEGITWAFLYSDVCHEVRPVLSGTRITVAYDVWHFKKLKPLQSLEIISDPVKQHLSALLDDTAQFMPNGGRIAFGTQHSYSLSSGKQSVQEGFKGGDAVLVTALDQLGLTWSLMAAYDPDHPHMGYYFEYPGENESDSDGGDAEQLADRGVYPDPAADSLASGIVDVRSTGTRHKVFTSRTFYAFSDGYYEDNIFDASIRDGAGGFEEDVIWITEPDQFGHENIYTAYGNEPITSSIYVAAAIFVKIPPGSERAHRGGRTGAVQV